MPILQQLLLRILVKLQLNRQMNHTLLLLMLLRSYFCFYLLCELTDYKSELFHYLHDIFHFFRSGRMNKQARILAHYYLVTQR
jgi:hypothetical protein